MRVVVRLLGIGVVFGVVFGACLLLPGSAHAETATWEPPTPKGVVGADGIRCHGEATQDGETYSYTNYIGADGNQPVEAEHRWQENECRWVLEQDIGRWFQFRHNIVLDPANIKMTITRL